MKPRFLAAGDGGLVVELGNAIDPELNARVRALDAALRASSFAGYEEAIPSYRSLLVLFEPGAIGFGDAREHVRSLLDTLDPAAAPAAPLKTVPTVYDGDDLDGVARQTGLTPDDVVRIHSATEYRVYMVGFTPGFAYMGLTDAAIDVPRRATPRTRVPAGSVAIAMRQTAIYPSATPGGWHLLGRAEHRTLFDASRTPPSFFAAGDRVQFLPVDALPELPDDRGVSPRAVSPVLEVQAGGLFTTVQDRGRAGFQRDGVPVGGAMDLPALEEANRLVGNEPGAAALECTLEGPRLRCLRPAIASIAGADLGAVVERADLGRWRPAPGSSFRLRPGNVLAFEGARRGARAYLAFAGGIDVPVVLGSRSTYVSAGLGGYGGRALEAGDRLALLPRGGVVPATPPPATAASDDDIRFIWGPQDDYFTDAARTTLESCRYEVAPSSDRMGYRLEGEVLSHRGANEILSDGNAPGSIQVPPDGLPIVLLADRATTGGYPKIATVLRADLPKLAQKRPGDPIRFRAVRA